MGKRSRRRKEMNVIARLNYDLLREIATGKQGWYSVSQAIDGRFEGVFIIQARGPTEATLLFKERGWYVRGCDTIAAEISPGLMELVPETHRWRKLSEGEVKSLRIFNNLEDILNDSPDLNF
jgi:hypothetical protein